MYVRVYAVVAELADELDSGAEFTRSEIDKLLKQTGDKRLLRSIAHVRANHKTRIIGIL